MGNAVIALVRRCLVVIALAALCACGQPAGLDRLSAGEAGRVVEVRSGHVLVLDDGLVVRLAGVEAPALSQPYGQEARDALSALVLNRPVQLLYGGARRDRYGRALAQVRLVKGRRWVEGEMLALGAARVRTWNDNRALAPEMLEVEARARRRAAGLWALAEYRVLLPGETRGRFGLQVVEGRVARVRNEGSSVWLDLSGGRVSAQVPAAALSQFADAGRAPQDLAGRLVRLRGSLSGGNLRLDHPEAVEVLKSR